ncbi:multiple epidermal growth factor-like domains protein 10 isoform X2 [Ostrea edulis]|uniref:multiple epidermal growth factor-like domains protein 10 isoform X2 n=1 Tax=Ostrea edulis TaxID=37623 RepID=UPI0024AF6CF1|nr:multiple epidermal growth factor-like domains protein 10 isoform X2 [Ostrea edulis]
MTTFQLEIIMILFSQELISAESTKKPNICQEVLIGLSNCCAGTTWDDHQKECVQCNPGFRGLNCSEHCPLGVFGRRCQSICPQECQHCHHITGGCLTEQNECDPGFRGLNCSELCPRGVFGRRCQSACPQECQYCHHITGGCLTDQNRFVGHNCSFRCPRGVFGRRCQSICPQDCQDCHHITGECLTDQNGIIPRTSASWKWIRVNKFNSNCIENLQKGSIFLKERIACL